MVEENKGINMNWNWLQRIKHWFQTNKRLHEENLQLKHANNTALSLINGLNNTLTYNVVTSENMRNECFMIFGAAALQHNGELIIKSDFIKMFTSPEYRLQVNISHTDDGGVCIKTIEAPQEQEQKTDEPI